MNMQEKNFISSVRFLKSAKQFRELTEDEIKKIVSIGKEENFVEEQSIFHEGMSANAFYIILSGSIRIVKKIKGGVDEVLALIREGEFFGEMALLDDYNRSATAISHRDSTLLVIPKDKFRELLFSDKDLSNKLLWIFVKTLSLRLREADERMSDSFFLLGKSGVSI